MAFNSDVSWANRAAKAVLLIRILVGWVFLSEGIQKFLFPETLGVGRFLKIGIPWPQVMAPFVGVVEILCGTLLLIGLLTRLAAIPLVIDICVALYSTKIVTLAKNGIWSTLHEARTDAYVRGTSQHDGTAGNIHRNEVALVELDHLSELSASWLHFVRWSHRAPWLFPKRVRHPAQMAR